MTFRTILIMTALTAAQPIWAQEDGNGISFHFGLGPKSAPEYFGSDENELGVTGSFRLERLQFGGLSIGGEDRTGFGFGGSVRFIGERSADEYPELAGLEDIDPSLELGGGLRFRQPGYRIFADMRYGVVGHEALVAEVGGDIIYRPTDQITLTAGPRVLWGSEDYAQTYFGVSDSEAGASAFDAYTPGSGIISQGLKAEATYQINEDWGVVGTVRYDQLVDDAADSPITRSDNQVSASIVLTRRVTFGF